MTRTEPNDPLALVGSKEFQEKENRLALLEMHATCVASARELGAR